MLLLLLGSHSGVDARTPKSLALLSFIVGLHALVSQTFHALTRPFSFFMFLEKGFLELVQHSLEVLDILHAELCHVLLELSFLIVDLLLQFNNALSQS